MIVDKQEHKDALIELIRISNFPGSSIELINELYEALKYAEISAQKPDKASEN